MVQFQLSPELSEPKSSLPSNSLGSEIFNPILAVFDKPKQTGGMSQQFAAEQAKLVIKFQSLALSVRRLAALCSLRLNFSNPDG
jgi:hypothetical protein